MSQIHINTRSLFLILAVLISEVATAGVKDVYVISNRETVLEDDNSTTLNRVKTNSSLDFMIANEAENNSLMIARTDSVQFISEMSDLNGDWVVFVHGDAKTLDQSVKRGIAIQEEYDINVLIFSWPSKDPSLGGVRNFKRSRSHVGESLGHFMQMLDFVQAFKDVNSSFQNDQKISLLFHSLGNLYMESMVENDLQLGLQDDLFDNLILNAAAVNEERHNEWVEKLDIQDRIYITSNKHDFNLKGLRIFTSDGKQLGEVTQETLASNAHYVHFDKSIGFRIKTGQSHTYFVGEIPKTNPKIKSFYSTLFHGEEANFSDSEVFDVREDKLGYEMIAES